jgi:2-polyprenyl-3-methyl-5-hydroxy-6-metoxy-1,4-benzoquinol methylase
MSTYPISQNKVSDILSLRKEVGERFPKLAVFVVAYNAQKTLRETIERIPKEIYDILDCIYIIDDFSDDQTYETAKSMLLERTWDKLRIFRNPRNYGYGGNQKIGYRYAIEQKFDYVILLHGDGQYAPEMMPNLIWPVLFEGKQVVFGSRMIKKRDALKGKMPFYKFIGNIVLTKLENYVLNTRMSEFHSGYRLYSTDVLSKIPFELNSDGFNFDTQIIIQCFILGIPIHEVPIPTFYGDEKCYVDGFQYAKNVFQDALDFRLHQIHLKRNSRYIIEKEEPYRLKKSRYSSHQQIAELVNPDSKVLDIGCAYGFMSELLNSKHVDYWGIDQLPANKIRYPMSKYIQVDLEHFSDLELGREFDCIIVADVIEHIRNASALLSTIKKYLKPEGRLIISTGNIAIWFYRLSLLIGRFKYASRGILDETHVKLYTLDTFKELIISSGFKIHNARYTSIPFELIFESRGKSQLISYIESIYYRFVKWWPRLFAYQFIVEAEISSLDFVRKEGAIGNH